MLAINRSRSRLLFLLCLVFAVSLGNNDTGNDGEELSRLRRIIGGKVVPDGENKFVVLVRKLCGKDFRESVCSGSVISKKHILTAAHCVMCIKRNMKMMTFSLNMAPEVFVLTPQGIHYGAMAIVRPHRSAHFLVQHLSDVAIIELNEGDEFKVKPVKLAADYRSDVIKSLTAYGFGVHEELIDDELELKMDEKLRVAEIPIFKESWYTLNGGHAGLMMLSGDSGGPLVKEFKGEVYQFAVASAHTGNKKDVLHGDIEDQSISNVYMKVPTYCAFIETFTDKMAMCEKVPW